MCSFHYRNVYVKKERLTSIYDPDSADPRPSLGSVLFAPTVEELKRTVAAAEAAGCDVVYFPLRIFKRIPRDAPGTVREWPPGTVPPCPPGRGLMIMEP